MKSVLVSTSRLHQSKVYILSCRWHPPPTLPYVLIAAHPRVWCAVDTLPRPSPQHPKPNYLTIAVDLNANIPHPLFFLIHFGPHVVSAVTKCVSAVSSTFRHDVDRQQARRHTRSSPTRVTVLTRARSRGSGSGGCSRRRRGPPQSPTRRATARGDSHPRRRGPSPTS